MQPPGYNSCTGRKNPSAMRRATNPSRPLNTLEPLFLNTWEMVASRQAYRVWWITLKARVEKRALQILPEGPHPTVVNDYVELLWGSLYGQARAPASWPLAPASRGDWGGLMMSGIAALTSMIPAEM